MRECEGGAEVSARVPCRLGYSCTCSEAACTIGLLAAAGPPVRLDRYCVLMLLNIGDCG